MKSQAPNSAPKDIDISLSHMQAELTRIDARIGREVQRWRLAGQDPGDLFRGLHVSGAEADALLARPFATSFGISASLEPQVARAYADAETQAANRAQNLVEMALNAGEVPRLIYLTAAFGLDRFDLDTLLICLAPALDLRYERVYAFLQDDVTRKRPTVNLVLNVLCNPDPADHLGFLLRFADDAPLFRHHLLERITEPGANHTSTLGQALAIDPGVVSWLLGDYQPHAELGPHARLSRSVIDEDDALLAGGTEKIDAILDRISSADAPPIMVFHGPDGVAQEAAARLLVARVGRSMLKVNLAAITAASTSPLRALQLALRDARLTGSIPFLSGWDACLAGQRGLTAGDGDSNAADRPAPTAAPGSSPAPDLMDELCAFPDLVIVSGKATWQAEGVERQRVLLGLAFPLPPYARRTKLWEHYLADLALSLHSATGDEPGILDLSALAGQFALTTGQIRDAAAAARDRMVQTDKALQIHDLLAAARASSNPRLSSLAHKITPRFTWSDIVLPDDQIAMLQEVVAMVRRRSVVLEDWGVGQKLVSSPGVTMLFSGPPGTGKTMAAEVIASELALDLYKIDLSSIVSKYIGETEKNLEKIFGEAQSSNAILFFDEADAIFGKRSEVKDAHDRYANIEVSYLLQRMEAYDGVTILATNLRANLDDAFTRRLQFAIDFPFPEEDYRLRIWQTLFPPGVPRGDDLDFEFLARRFKLAGGNIRNILVSAAYLAAEDGRCVTMKHLLHGTRRELQKMGRLVNEKDLSL